MTHPTDHGWPDDKLSMDRYHSPSPVDTFKVKVFLMKRSDFIYQTLEYQDTVNWRGGPSVFRHFEDKFRQRAGDLTLSLWRFSETSEDETLNSPDQTLPAQSENLPTMVGMRSPSVQRIGTKDFGGDSDPDRPEESQDLEAYVTWCRNKYKDENTAYFWAYHLRSPGAGSGQV
jgi:hypothetical protein